MKYGGGEGRKEQRDEQVRNVEVLRIVKEERHIPHTVKISNADWIGHILRMNCLLKQVIEGKIEKITAVKFGYQRSRKLRNCYV